MGIYLDNDGAAFGVWQGREFAGAGVANEPGSLVWNELMSRDVDGAKVFYRNAFGLASLSRRQRATAPTRTPSSKWTVVRSPG